MTETVFKVMDGADVTLPKRSTEGSAGYDFVAREDITIPSYWEGGDTATLVPTGITSKFSDKLVLNLHSRSSLSTKSGLMLANGVGVVDSDYRGEICFAYLNMSRKPKHIKKGDRIGQGVFNRIEFTEDDEAYGVRTGGFGSTGV